MASLLPTLSRPPPATPEEDRVTEEEVDWLKLKGREEKEKEEVKEEDEEEEKRSFFTGPFWNTSKVSLSGEQSNILITGIFAAIFGLNYI